ncbi:MAG: hypothetical protein ABI628_05530, partial [Chloroflexota bacterium]
EIYDPRSGTFAGTGALLVPGGSSDVTGKLGNDALSLDDGRALLLVQKHRHRMGPEWDLQAYDPATGRFSSQGTIESANEAEAPVRFLQQPDGHIVIVGASLTPSVTPTQDMSVFWIDWPTIQPTKIGTISGCGTVVAVQLASGDRIAVLCRPSGLSASVVLFDLASGATSWIAVPMSPGAAALVRLADGRLLAAGGSEPTTLSLVDPATATAMPAGIVDTAPASPASWPETANTSVTVLADGRVLILSGSKASVWDPATGTATSIPGPIASRDGHSATLLDDGQVLIFGGTTWAADKGIPPPPAVELFNPDAIP